MGEAESRQTGTIYSLDKPRALPPDEVLCRLNTYDNVVFHIALCGPVLRVPGGRFRGPGFDSRRSQMFCVAVGLEPGPLSPCEDKCGAT
jgi:hypothetical protein